MIMQNIGSFAGYIRRPKPMNTGYIAYFFGENGSDADLITTLSLTKFLNLDVHITVYLIKDAVGVDKKDNETGKYPIIAQFQGKIQRPKPSDTGMMAQFFAINGENADEVNRLGESSLLDALVFVDLNGINKNINYNEVNIYKNQDEKNQREIVKNHAWKVAEKEKHDYMAKTKKYLSANKALHESDLFLNKDLMKLINDLDEKYTFKSFLLKQKCIYKKQNVNCEHNATNLVQLRKGDQFSFVQFCDEHYELMYNEEDRTINYEQIDGKQHYLELKNILLLKQWVWDFFIQEFSLTGQEEPNSVKIYLWLVENGFRDLIPKKFERDAIILSK